MVGIAPDKHLNHRPAQGNTPKVSYKGGNSKKIVLHDGDQAMGALLVSQKSSGEGGIERWESRGGGRNMSQSPYLAH